MKGNDVEPASRLETVDLGLYTSQEENEAQSLRVWATSWGWETHCMQEENGASTIKS